MRGLKSKLALFSVLAATGVGCAVPQSELQRRNAPTDLSAESDPATDSEGQRITVRGSLSTEGNGSTENGMAGPNILKVASKVDISALGEHGELTPVATTDVKADGTFDANVGQKQSATGLFIVQAKNVVGAVVGSAVLNGIPAFAYGFLIDIPIDTLTSFKTEVLMTIARGGTPGIQNFLNVIDTFLDGELAGIIVTSGAFVQDFTTILSAVSDATIATANVIVSALNQVGIPIDISSLTNAQSAVVGGIVKLTNGANSKVVSKAKNLLSSLKAATAKVAAPVDEALFNAVVNSGAMFDSKMKAGMPASMSTDLAFALAKSLFKVQTEMSTAMTEDSFDKMGVGSNVMELLKTATEAFNLQVADAKSVDDLESAKSQFKNVLLGKDDSSKSIVRLLVSAAVGSLRAILNEVQGVIAPVAKDLTLALQAPFDSLEVGNALAKFDADTKNVPDTFMKGMGAAEAKVMASALTRVEKVIAR